MKRLKNLSGNVWFIAFVLAMIALVICGVLLIEKCNCPSLGPKVTSSDTTLSIAYHIPDTLAKNEVIRYQDFVKSLAPRLQGDIDKIPKYFTVDNYDFLEAMGVDSVRRDSLQLKYFHSRLYIALDTDSTLHLLFTPVVGAKRDSSLCSRQYLSLGKDFVRKGIIPNPSPCQKLVKRYGGQQEVDRIFQSKDNLSSGILFDLNAPCPTTCLTLDSTFVGQQ